MKRSLFAPILSVLVCLWVASSQAAVLVKPTAKTFSSKGGAGSVSFTVAGETGLQTAVPISVSPQAPWLTLDKGPGDLPIPLNSKGAGKGKVLFHVGRYDRSSPNPRQAVILVDGQPFTVTQTGVPCALTVKPTSSGPLPSGGDGGSFEVTAPPGCGWTAAVAPTAAWLAIGEPATGEGSGTVHFEADENTTEKKRSGSIVVQTQTAKPTKKTHKVSQAAAEEGETTGPAKPSVDVSIYPYGASLAAENSVRIQIARSQTKFSDLSATVNGVPVPKDTTSDYAQQYFALYGEDFPGVAPGATVTIRLSTAALGTKEVQVEIPDADVPPIAFEPALSSWMNGLAANPVSSVLRAQWAPLAHGNTVVFSFSSGDGGANPWYHRAVRGEASAVFGEGADAPWTALVQALRRERSGGLAVSARTLQEEPWGPVQVATQAFGGGSNDPLPFPVAGGWRLTASYTAVSTQTGSTYRVTDDWSIVTLTQDGEAVSAAGASGAASGGRLTLEGLLLTYGVSGGSQRFSGAWEANASTIRGIVTGTVLVIFPGGSGPEPARIESGTFTMAPVSAP